MTEEFLNGSDICSGLKQMRRERMSERMAARLLGDSGLQDGLLDGPLQDGFVEMVTATLAGPALGVDSGCWEYPLPWPFAAGVSIFFDEGVGERDVTGTTA
jgi:hypothetical protein